MAARAQRIGILTGASRAHAPYQPADVLRNLKESKRLLEEARQELQDQAEKAQIPVSHTFSPLPGFHNRPRELQALERALGSVPSMTVLFGASSVGKTALCRQVLSNDKYHCISFDLRLAGFADLHSLYTSLASQMESFFASMPQMLGKEWGWDVFEKESYAFKHDKADVLQRIADGGAPVSTADVARLLEFFQSALLKYWEFEPKSEEQRKREEEEAKQDKSDAERKPKARDGSKQTLERGPTPTASKEKEIDLEAARTVKEDETKATKMDDTPQPPPKKVPVLLLDESHKLPALIQSDSAMKTILDSGLVFSKQDRLLHVVHATSDPFYMHWLRQMNVMQHANILSIGDCSQAEARQYWTDVLRPRMPEKLRLDLSFEEVYQVFGGKLAHLSDYVTEYINSDGQISPELSSHFLQAHSLLNLQLIHSMPSKSGEDSSFEIYSPLAQASPHAAPSPFVAQSPNSEVHPPARMSSPFSSADLLLVMARLCSEPAIRYFPLCRELGARAVDGMVRGRILELRWSKTITPEGTEEEIKARDQLKGTGPILVPTTPVVRYAMRTVLQEYADELQEVHGIRWDEEWSKVLAADHEKEDGKSKTSDI
ncbi:hypothetical protein ACM66B_002260 [Microbotryomycetes sp. NB124-2]